MAEANQAYLGHGDWIEFRDAVPPMTGQHVDIPLRDVAPLIIEVLRRDLLNSGQAARILAAAEDSLIRQADSAA